MALVAWQHRYGGFRAALRLVAGCVAILAFLGTSGIRAAEPTSTYFDIPAQLLSTALLRFSEQAKVQITAPSGLVGDRRTSGIRGEYDAAQALERMLDGSGLSYEFINEHAVAIRVAGAVRRSTGRPSAESAAYIDDARRLRLASAQSNAAADAANVSGGPGQFDEAAPNENDWLEHVTILSKRLRMERRAEGAKLPVRQLDLPQSVTVIDRELMNDQNVVELQDALRNAGGVVPGGYFEGFDYYRIRGFDSSGFTFLDGLLADQTFWTQEELFGMEQVEVLKGPVSGLFGQAPAGGLVNLVSKRPQRDNFLGAQASIGSHDYRDLGLDGNTELSESLALRVNALYRERGSFVDNVPVAKRYFLAPALRWDISKDTRITFLGQLIEEDTGLAQPLPAEGTVLPNPNGKLPISRAVGEPAVNDSADISRKHIGWDLTHDFNEVLSLRQVSRASTIDVDFQSIYPWYLDSDLRTLNRYMRKQKVKADAYAADTQLIAKIESGRFVHTMLGGVDWYSFQQDQGFAYAGFSSPFAPLDLFDPQYGLAEIPDFAVTSLSSTDLERTGIYYQHHVKINGRFSVLAGGRYDWTDDGNAKDSKFTPRFGATYEFIPDAALFVSYARSFQPQAGYVTAEGNPLPAETGEQYEIGLKTQLFNDRLTGTVALYQLTRQNVATDDPNSEEYVFIATGEQRSRGFEIDGVVRLTPSWEIVGNYTYTDAEVTKDNDLVPGSRTVNIPKNAFSLWTKYVVPEGVLGGLGLSLGVRSYDRQAGDLDYRAVPDDTFELPSHTIVDAGLSYDFGAYAIRFNVSNVTDERYFPASFSKTFVMPGEPRSYRLGVAYDLH